MKKDTQLVKILRKACDEAGSNRKWCLAHDVPPWLVGEILNGKKAMRPQIASALGYKLDHYVRVGFWEEVKKK